MESVEVSSSRSTFYNSIDRKVYDIGRDVQGVTGSASNLLQNVPSVDVDIEGNVSLRGDSNVLILIDGKTSTLMGPNRAAVLEQLPADSIEKIEVITNPSAKYKPDGTAGIINLTLKKKRAPGYSGSIRASARTVRTWTELRKLRSTRPKRRSAPTTRASVPRSFRSTWTPTELASPAKNASVSSSVGASGPTRSLEWATTSPASSCSTTSNSTRSTPWATAARNERSVFSGARTGAPR